MPFLLASPQGAEFWDRPMAAPVPPAPHKEEGNAISELQASLVTLAMILTGDEQVQSRWPDHALPIKCSIL